MPLLHVSLWDDPVAYDDGDDQCYLGFPIEPRPDIVAGRLLAWSVANWDVGHMGPQWSYSIRLLALDRPDQLGRLVVDPALTLLGARQQLMRNGKVDEDIVRKVLPDDWLGVDVLRYQPHHFDGKPAPIS